MSRAPWRIQPNIWVELGTHDVPEPSWLIGSATSVVDGMSIALDVPMPFGFVAGIVITGGGVVAGVPGAAGPIVMPGIGAVAGAGVRDGAGPIVMPGIGAIVGFGALGAGGAIVMPGIGTA